MPGWRLEAAHGGCADKALTRMSDGLISQGVFTRPDRSVPSPPHAVPKPPQSTARTGLPGASAPKR